MKISIMTLHAVKNYGSVLQAFATQELFKEYGLEVELINFIREDVQDKNLIKTWTRNDKGIKKLAKGAIIYPTFIRWKKVFNSFLDNHVNLTKQKYYNEKDFKENMPQADIYCVGSDQVWNSGWNKGFVRPLYLSFVPDKKPKISLASSFGKSQLDEWEKEETRELLSRFKNISVREISAVKILDDLGIVNATHVLDPTLLMDGDFWRKYSDERIIKEKYVLVYQLNTNKEFDKYAQKFAKLKGLKLVRLCTRYDQILKTGHSILVPEVLEFVSLFKYAEYVITDSFHGTAFSLNLNKEFISIYPNEYSSRLDSILSLVNQKQRKLESYNDFTIADKNIEYNEVNKILNSEREKTRKYIEKAISIKQEM